MELVLVNFLVAEQVQSLILLFIIENHLFLIFFFLKLIINLYQFNLILAFLFQFKLYHPINYFKSYHHFNHLAINHQFNFRYFDQLLVNLLASLINQLQEHHLNFNFLQILYFNQYPFFAFYLNVSVWSIMAIQIFQNRLNLNFIDDYYESL